MPRRKLANNVFDEAVDRMARLYREGHRVVVSFSAGKDSGVCLEVCIIAAELTGRLPVDVLIRDEEVMLPGTYEYAERVARRPEVVMHWIYARQPVINVFNRASPYFWVFDPHLKPEQWVRQPPPYAYEIPDKSITYMITPERFPPAKGKQLFSVIGLRCSESKGRLYGLYISRGYLTKPNKAGVRYARPIYDWSDGDVWKAHNDLKWDYNSAYDVMHRLGRPRSKLRIAPPTMNVYGVTELALAQQGWPRWFDKVCERLPGVRTAAQFGKHSVMPIRRSSETWEQCFRRTCIDEAPQWVAERARRASEAATKRHLKHATAGLPQVERCESCYPTLGSWKAIAEGMYNGDPFSMKGPMLPYVEPEFFRTGAGVWGGAPSF